MRHFIRGWYFESNESSLRSCFMLKICFLRVSRSGHKSEEHQKTSITMVESKVFDQDDSPPLVPVIPSAPLEQMLVHVEPLDLDNADYPQAHPVVVTMDGPDEDMYFSEDEEREKSLMVGAGVAAGAMGCLIGGPLLACLAGFGAAHYTKKDGACGDCARALGHVALMAREKAGEVNRKHNLVEKGKQAAEEAWDKAKDMDRRHNLLDRTKAFLASSFEALKEANRKHNFLERATEAVGKALTFVATKVNETFFKEGQLGETAAADYAHEKTAYAASPTIVACH
jgi:hypothetical protein